MSEQPLFSVRNPWFNASVGVTAAIAMTPAVIAVGVAMVSRRVSSQGT